MTTRRTGTPWMASDAYGKTLTGLSLNLIVRDVQKSVPFYRDVLGMTVHYSDEDMAALQLDSTQIVLHADHTYDKQPWAPRLAEAGKRGLGAEIRILGIDPDAAERRAKERGSIVLLGARDWPHGWRDVILEDPDGYTFAVGTVLP
ncbi:MAG TPA: VOC family protein [Candidatus Limnocylindria bacterium]|nr:VOC family protein [Candidatus Limnocylindria bacterium]